MGSTTPQAEERAGLFLLEVVNSEKAEAPEEYSFGRR